MKYIAYCRKSTDEPDRQILSIEAQITEVKEFATRENLEIIEYIIESKTAKSPGRGEFNRMVKLLEA
ncbi:recombinase family protein, partial [Candidatus Shapirobacteria bacterium CG06_land_8_20_14_3_00_40_12]